MLADEYGTASNIKSRVNRLSVLSAITSTQQRLKLYNKVPTNGLVVWVFSEYRRVWREGGRKAESWDDRLRPPALHASCLSPFFNHVGLTHRPES